MNEGKLINVLYTVRVWSYGGSHTIMRILLNNLPKHGFRIICVPFETRSKGEDGLIRRLQADGHELPPERLPWHSRLDVFQARNRLARLIEKYDIDLLHTHDPQSNVLFGLCRARWRCAAVASAYGWWERPSPRVSLYRWCERNQALPNFERVITVSQNMKAKILRGPCPEERIRVIHTGLDLGSIRDSTGRDNMRNQFGFEPDDVVVGTVSRVEVEKGHRYLLDAAAQLRDRCPRLRLLIVGEGAERSNLQAQAHKLGIADRIVFPGFVDSLADALASMDIFAQPTILDEGFPTAVLEAQVAGLPVVCSDSGGTCETMRVGQTGLLVPRRDAAQLAQALEQLAADPSRRAEMGRAGREFVEESFTLENMVSQVAQTYCEALQAYGEPSENRH